MEITNLPEIPDYTTVLGDMSAKLVDLQNSLGDLSLQLTYLSDQLFVIQQGLQVLLYIATAFFVWLVIRLLWGLFYGWFFRGV